MDATGPDPSPLDSMGPDGAETEYQKSKIKNDSDLPPHRKIARLPRPFRQLINSMLEDGAPAVEIIAKLDASTDPPLPYTISEKNISDWRSTGYRRYLAQQERLTLVQSNREGAGDLLANDDLTTLPEATLQIVANQYYEFIADFSTEALKQKLAEDPLKYTRVLNVFARLAREIVHLRKFRAASTTPSAPHLRTADLGRVLSDNEFDFLVNQMDKVFKVARPSRPPVTENPSPATNHQPPITGH